MAVYAHEHPSTTSAPHGHRAMTFRFTVAGIPAAQGSKRYLGRGILIESSKRVAPWRSDVRTAAEAADVPFGALPFEGPLAVGLIFRLPRPKAHLGARGLRSSAPAIPSTRPDLDKLTRAVLDALTGLAWLDDCQVAQLDVSKVYADGSGPGVDVEVAPCR